MIFQAFNIQKYPDWACLKIKIPDTDSRVPIHLCCVIDTSISMSMSNKLENVKQSLQFLTDFLNPSDLLTIITFSDVARTIINQVNVTINEKNNIRNLISQIDTESNTNIGAGIIQTHESLLRSPHQIKQGILLLTDGVANIGLTHSSDIIELVHNTVTNFNGTSISCVGYGTDHNIELLQSISSDNNGSYYVVNTIEDVAIVFGDILGGLLTCIAERVTICLPNNTQVKSGYTVNCYNNTTEILIGDISSGREAIVLAKIPPGNTVILKGYNITTNDTFEINTVISNFNDYKIQIDAEAHYLRFDVLALIESSRYILSQSAELYRLNNIQLQILKINECLATIFEYTREHEHPLWEILVDELNNCKYILENTHNTASFIPYILSQRVEYLGRMNGLPASLSIQPTSLINNNLPSPRNYLANTFSNTIQRQISSQMVDSVTSTAPIESCSSTCSLENVEASLPNPFLVNRMHTHNSSDILNILHLTRQVACSTPLYTDDL